MFHSSLLKKKKRGENWHPEDKELLQELVREKIAIIEDKNTDTNTNYRKVKAWRAIAQIFNATSISKRNVSQLRCQWSIIKMNAKKNAQLNCRSSKVDVCEAVLPDENISVWLPQQNAANNETSAKIEQSTHSTAPALSIQEHNISDAGEDCTVDGGTNATDFDFQDARRKALRKKLKRRRNYQTENAEYEDSSAPNNLASYDYQCRVELHEAQISNEQRKARNLDLEHKILLEQLTFYQRKNEINL